MTHKKVIVFFARDFLSDWYSSFLEKYCFDDIPMCGRATNGGFAKIIRAL